MSKPKLRIKGFKRSCAKKQRFGTMDEAVDASKCGWLDFMSAYMCKKCNFFHYGHPSVVYGKASHRGR